MKTTIFRVATLIASTILVAALTACSGVSNSNTGDQPLTSKLTREQATQIAENALQAYNMGSFAGYSREWGDGMKPVKESDFKAFHQERMNLSGKYISITSVELTKAKTPGHVRWVFNCDFEKGKVRFTLVFKQDGDKIEGALFENAG